MDFHSKLLFFLRPLIDLLKFLHGWLIARLVQTPYKLQIISLFASAVIAIMSKLASDGSVLECNLKSISTLSIILCAFIAYCVSTVASRIEDEKEARQTITISLAAICYAWAESVTLKDYVGTTLEALIIIVLVYILLTLPKSKEEVKHRIYLMHSFITLSAVTLIVGQGVLCIVRKIDSEYYVVGQGASFFMISFFLINIFGKHLTLLTAYKKERKQNIFAMVLVLLYSFFGAAVIHPRWLPKVTTLDFDINVLKIFVISASYSAILCFVFGKTTQAILDTHGSSLVRIVSNRTQIIKLYCRNGALAGLLCGLSTSCIRFFDKVQLSYAIGHIVIETCSYMICGILLGHLISNIAPSYQKNKFIQRSL